MKLAAPLSALLLTLTLFCSAAKAQKSEVKTLIPHVYNSVAELFIETESGSMKMACTATAFERKTQSGTPVVYKYRFVSAAHCVPGDSDSQQKQQKFFISDDVRGEKTFTEAKLVEAGDKSKGDDFSLFEVESGNLYEFIPLGDNKKLELDDSVISVAAPHGLGKQFFIGYVSQLNLDRPPIDAGIVQWTDLMQIEIGGGPGSSGSSIVSVDQGAIVGFLVGSASSDIGKLCVPVSKFKKFVELVDSGKYKKERKSGELPTGSEE